MAFDKEELKQLDDHLDNRFNKIHSEIIFDIKSIIQPLKDDVEYMKERLDQSFETESEDILAVYSDIDNLKKRVRKLELKRA